MKATSAMPKSASAARRSHYENAFEDYLKSAGVSYVAVADVRQRVPGRLGIKSFDYIVYPANEPPCMVDVKGRKFAGRGGKPTRRWDSWVTRADVDGLARWQEVFGPDFTAAFVFAYWLPTATALKPDMAEGRVFGGRVYSFWGVDLAGYREHLKTRSQRWKTVDLPAEHFIRLAWPLSKWLAEAGGVSKPRA